jgi:hypothetical protein
VQFRTPAPAPGKSARRHSAVGIFRVDAFLDVFAGVLDRITCVLGLFLEPLTGLVQGLSGFLRRALVAIAARDSERSDDQYQ